MTNDTPEEEFYLTDGSDHEPDEATDTPQRHFTAWLTNVRSCLDTPFVDVLVHEDIPDGEAGWIMDTAKEPEFHATTNVPADSDEDATPAVVALLAAAGWTIAGDWDAINTGAIVPVTRDED